MVFGEAKIDLEEDILFVQERKATTQYIIVLDTRDMLLWDDVEKWWMYENETLFQYISYLNL